MNALLTGPPRSGKTTALERTVDRLRERGLTVGGVLTLERRVDGERVGFASQDLATGERAVIAHVDHEVGPRVGKYRVDVGAVETLAVPAIERALRDADAVVIDEIAAMQRHSDAFLSAVDRALDAPIPVVAAIESGTEGAVGAYKRRSDTTVRTVTPENREALPARLVFDFQNR